jgi:hypothetical protein
MFGNLPPLPAAYVFSVMPDCRVARPRAFAWACLVPWGRQPGHPKSA